MSVEDTLGVLTQRGEKNKSSADGQKGIPHTSTSLMTVYVQITVFTVSIVQLNPQCIKSSDTFEKIKFLSLAQ